MTCARLTIAALVLGLLISPRADAHEYEAGALTIDHPWARVILTSRPAAFYMTIKNPSGEPDRLLSATSSAAERVALHTHIVTDGIARMRPIEAIEIPAKGEVAFKPGGLHLMVFGLKTEGEPLDLIPVTLEFEKAGKVEIQGLVKRGPGTSGEPDHSEHGSKHGHHGHGK